MAIGRNDPCPCGSGKKYKQCCINRSEQLLPAKPANSTKTILMALAQQGEKQFLAENLSAAESIAHQIVALQSTHAGGWHLLGLIAHKKGEFSKAEQYMYKALSITKTGIMLGNLGSILVDLGKFTEAANTYRDAFKLIPNNALFVTQLAKFLAILGHKNEAVSYYEKALLLAPHSAEAHADLGFLLHAQGKKQEALACYQKALALKPDWAVVHSNAGGLLQTSGKIHDAVESFKAGLALEPHNTMIYSNMLFALQYMHDISPKELFEQHLEFAKRYEAPLKPLWPNHATRPANHQRLKIGYVSADLYFNHSVSFFMEPVLYNHDKNAVEIFCYHNSHKNDATTQKLQAHVDHWLPCVDLSDDELCARIMQDGIDILVDLSGHTGDNRLMVFARKPAPVQITWIGYPGTTGLEAMDYRLTDAALDPVGLTEQFHSEELIRLPMVAVFQPSPVSPPVNRLPALSSDRVVLGCLNNLAKINVEVIRLWARILQAIPHADLMLGNITPQNASAWVDLFEQEGIPPERLILQPRTGMKNFLALHHQIDLCLDPFPYGGGTTTNHALWMGVPTVTLAGQTTASRHGAYNLTAVGLTEFITQSEEEYVARVLDLLSDLPRLDEIRQSLRERINQQPQRDPVLLTRHVEAAYQQVWQRYLAKTKQIQA